jgi:hypothetical protein
MYSIVSVSFARVRGKRREPATGARSAVVLIGHWNEESGVFIQVCLN